MPAAMRHMVMSMDRIPTPIETGVGTATRLLTWLSPAFPVGGFSYSHGLEYAIEAGLVRDQASLSDWVDGILRFGAGRNDGLLLLAAHRAAMLPPYEHLAAIAEQAAALRGTAELAKESTAQGQAFLKAVASGWPTYADAAPVKALAGCQLTYPIIVGCLCAVAGIPAETALEAYLTVFANNLISAGIRLVPLGQSDGLRIVATLEPRIIAYVQSLSHLSLDDLGGSALAVDWSSMKHETQYTRLFRS